MNHAPLLAHGAARANPALPPPPLPPRVRAHSAAAACRQPVTARDAHQYDHALCAPGGSTHAPAHLQDGDCSCAYRLVICVELVKRHQLPQARGQRAELDGRPLDSLLAPERRREVAQRDEAGARDDGARRGVLLGRAARGPQARDAQQVAVIDELTEVGLAWSGRLVESLLRPLRCMSGGLSCIRGGFVSLAHLQVAMVRIRI